MTPRLVHDTRARLGEGPVWVASEQALYWVDIEAPAIHRLDPASGAHCAWPMPEAMGSIAPRAGGGWIGAARSGFVAIDLAANRVTPLAVPVAIPRDGRFNDGKVDPGGRFWAGTMHPAREPAEGTLYRLGPDLAATAMAGGVGISNGLAWSSDGGTLYFADSRANAIYAFDVDRATGAIANRRDWVRTDPAGGVPDGAAMDVEGCYWSCQFGGGRVLRFAPDGTLLAAIALPVARPTMPAFGGPGLDRLYITSAQSDDPHAGGIFELAVGVRGVAIPPFAG